MYIERNEEKRQEYLSELLKLDPKKIIYMDESGIDSSLHRNYARAKRGTQIKTDISGKKTNRTSVIAGWFHATKQFIAPYVFDGYTDNSRFNEWLEKCLLPEVETGSTIIMDNASFHKGSKTKELIEKAGCKLLYLPPYSPDYNPIENQWAVLKAHYKTFKSRGYEHDNAIDAAFSI